MKMNRALVAQAACFLLPRYPSTFQTNVNVRLAMSTSTFSYPRAGVAATIQSKKIHNGEDVDNEENYYYLLIQRGRMPDAGKWSLPGGKIQWGESTIKAAQRELTEETGLPAIDCQWYSQPFMTTDAIVHSTVQDKGNDSGFVSSHYMIAHCFGRAPPGLPTVVAGDDAADARWWTVAEMEEKLVPKKQISDGVVRVIQQAQVLHKMGALTLLPLES